jgi:hypothetical protein
MSMDKSGQLRRFNPVPPPQRRTRLVPAFLLIGLLAPALPCESAATADRQPIATVEQVTARDANTRHWVGTYQVPEVDPATGQPTGRTVEQKESWIEKGTDICYDSREFDGLAAPTDAPQWELTDPRIETSDVPGFAYRLTKAPVRAYFTELRPGQSNVYLDARTGSQIQTQITGVFYYDPDTKHISLVDALRAVPATVSGNRLTYKGAFGCGSLEYIAGNSGVDQDLVVEDLAALPEPATLGFNPDTCMLMIGTALHDSAPNGAAPVLDRKTSTVLSRDIRSADLASVADRRKEGRGLSLELGEPTAAVPRCLAFEAGACFDASSLRALGSQDARTSVPEGQRRPTSGETDLHKVIEKANSQGDVTMLEGIEYSWLKAEGRTFPVRIDYTCVTKTGTMAPTKETWVKGVTYHVTSTYAIPTGKTLTIEPGAIVKVNKTSGTTIYGILCQPGGNLVCRGTQYDPISFVPSDCTTIGADVPSPPTYYNVASYLYLQSQCQSIEYCRFERGVSPVILEAKALDQRTLAQGPTIQHCTFTGDDVYGDYYPNLMIYIPTDAGAVHPMLSVFNCLFAKFRHCGIAGSLNRSNGVDSAGVLVQVANCTFDGQVGRVTDAVSLQSMYPSTHLLHVANNVFTNVTRGVYWYGSIGAQAGGYENNRYKVPQSGSFASGQAGTVNVTFGNATISSYTGGAQTYFAVGGPYQDQAVPVGASFLPGFTNGAYYMADVKGVGLNDYHFWPFELGGSINGGRPCNAAAFNRYAPSGGTDTDLQYTCVNTNSLKALGAASVVRPIRLSTDSNKSPRFNFNGSRHYTQSGYPDSDDSESAWLRGWDTTGMASAMALFPDAAADTEATDIGYHYPLVHAALDQSAVVRQGDLDLFPGLVVASTGSGSTFSFDGSARKFRALGTPSKYIRFIDYASVGDDPTKAADLYSARSASRANQYLSIDSTKMGPLGIQVQYCMFENAACGLKVFGQQNAAYAGDGTRAVIENCIFRYNGLGSTDGIGGLLVSHCDADVMNSLFFRNRNGITVDNSGSNGSVTKFQPNIIGCTFDEGERGVLFKPGYRDAAHTDASYEDHTHAVVENCVFANVYGGSNDPNACAVEVYDDASKQDSTKHLTAIMRRNLFWNCPRYAYSGDDASLNLATFKINSGPTNLPNDEATVANGPMFANATVTQSGSQDPYVGLWRLDEASASQHFLAQKPGDACREPFVCGQVTGLTSNFAYPQYAEIYIFGHSGDQVGGTYLLPSPAIPNAAAGRTGADCKRALYLGSQYAGSSTGICNAMLQFRNASPSAYTTGGGEEVVVSFAGGASGSGAPSQLKCRLPAGVTVGASQYMTFWIAKDGSLYWASSGKAPTASAAPDVDALSAMHGDKASVARSACTSANGSTADRPSPALGQGSHEWLNGGWTSTEYIAAFPQYLAHGVAPVTNDVRSANHILPRGYREGFIYLPRYGHPDRQQSVDAELSDQATELVRPLDLGFHYGGQHQKAAPGLEQAYSGGFVTLAPATFMLKPLPGGQGPLTLENNPLDLDFRTPRYELISASSSVPGRSWQTGLELFAVSAPRPEPGFSGVLVNPNDFAQYSIGSRLLRYDFANDDWVTMLSNHLPESPSPPVADTYALKSYLRNGEELYEYDAAKIITDMAGIAISSDAQTGAGDQYLAIAVAMVKYDMVLDGTLTYPAAGYQYIYLYYKSHLPGSQWQVEGAFGDPTDLSGSMPVVGQRFLTGGPPLTSAQIMYWLDATQGGELAITHDRSGRVHIFWTKDLWQDWGDRDELRHTSFIHGDSAPQTDSAAIVNSEQVWNYIPAMLTGADTVLGAAWDDDSRVADPLRVLWPAMQLENGQGSDYVVLRAARYSTDFRSFPQANRAALAGPDAEAVHRHNTIASADFTGRQDGAHEPWMQGAALRMGNFAASQSVGGGVSTWRCMLSSDEDNADDTWDTARFLPQAKSDGQGAVAARGIRIPRYAVLEDHAIAVTIDGSVLTDNTVTGARGEHPVIRTNRGLFVDQYMTARSYGVSAGTNLSEGPGTIYDPVPQVLSVVPLRP